MYLIAGLGNPGSKYAATRHNMGFRVVDALSDEWSIPVSQTEHRALVGKGFVGGEKVMLVKPQTFMNNSGESIGPLASYYGVEPDHIIVCYDDICLEPGSIRVRGKGSAGGHNGMKSIIAHLGSQDFPRVRVGVGEKPEHMDLADHVLGVFHGDDVNAALDGIDLAVKAVQEIMKNGVNSAQNLYNGKPNR